jgi:hypothetical protein
MSHSETVPIATRVDCATRLPKIIALLMAKNEQDIIEPAIRHNSRFLDALIVLDIGSSDATREIICELMREDDKVVLADFWDLRVPAGTRVTRFLNSCQEVYRADYIFLLDSDEFLEVSDRQTLEEALSAIPAQGFGKLPWQTYVLAPQDYPGCMADPPRSMRWRRAVENPQFYKAVLRLDGASSCDLIVEQGSHGIRRLNGEPVPCEIVDGVTLSHFPVRSRNQLISKCIVGWNNVLTANPNIRSEGTAFQWRENFDLIVQRKFPEGAALCEAALGYANNGAVTDWTKDIVLANPPADYARRYSAAEYPDPVSLIASEWEQSILVAGRRTSFERFELPRPETNAGATDAAWQWSNIYVDIPPFRWISEKQRPHSVLHVGCGIGELLALFKHLGAQEVYGIDALAQGSTVLGPSEYSTVNDLCGEMMQRTYELVLCLEVPGHVDKTTSLRQPEVIAPLATRRIIFSAPGPGQAGHDPSKCLPVHEWLSRWSAVGWIPDLSETLGMRSISTLSWLRRNLVVLRRGTQAEGEKSIQTIVAAGESPFTWKAHTPGIHYGAFLLPADHEPCGNCRFADATDRADQAGCRSDSADAAIAGERQWADALRERLDAAMAEASEARGIAATARAAAEAAEDVAQALRQADEVRRAKGRLRRVWAAWWGM